MIGNNIKRIRLSQQLTQTELAVKLGVSNKTVCSWEINRTEPKMGMVEKIANVLGCTKSDLVYDIPDEAIEPKHAAFGSIRPEASELIEKIDRLDQIDLVKADAYVDGLLSADKYKKDTSAGTA